MTAAPPAEDQSLLTVLIALGANALIAVAKSIVAFVTGSASMVAEAAHSWADTGNEIFLLVAERTSDREPDEKHPFGYGREAYVWSMFAAFGLFTAGAVVAIWHGVQSWSHPETTANYGWAYGVLALSFALEGISFLQARRQTQEAARKSGLHPLRYLALTSNPTLRAVFAEDAAALVGVLLAAAGIGLHQLTGDARWDSVGSILVGLLLGVIAVYLIDRNRDFLVGQAVSPPVRRRALMALLEDRDVEKVTFLHLEFVGPGKVLLLAATDITGDQPETLVAERLRAIAERVEAHELVEKAFITLSTPGDEGLRP
ncbi:MAG: cation diffusion facilitator family transporter [Intrasporangium sp.]|uniref:cation diffusion facilitator family transporter n=1 Tax=Intrasporangium sp. TaxID=1925024 RepID=UPI003F7DD83D